MPIASADALALLKQAHSQKRLAHAYLLCGPPGSGKRDLASGMCAHLLGCDPNSALKHPDVHSIAPESKSRRLLIEQLRELEQNLRMRSFEGGSKFAIIFEADRLQPQAANAFLKTLEEPPPNTHIFLLTEQPEQLLETILSRCVSVPLRPSETKARSSAAAATAELLNAFFSTQKPDLRGGLWLAQQFQALLNETKDAIHSTAEASFKAEEKQYKQTVDPKWLEQLEETHAARTEASYIGERGRMMEVFEAFWTDVLLCQNGGSPRHLPECGEHSRQIASHLDRDEAIRRVQAVTKLREHVGSTGVNEPLALEYGLLNGFAP